MGLERRKILALCYKSVKEKSGLKIGGEMTHSSMGPASAIAMLLDEGRGLTLNKNRYGINLMCIRMDESMMLRNVKIALKIKYHFSPRSSNMH